MEGLSADGAEPARGSEHETSAGTPTKGEPSGGGEAPKPHKSSTSGEVAGRPGHGRLSRVVVVVEGRMGVSIARAGAVALALATLGLAGAAAEGCLRVGWSHDPGDRPPASAGQTTPDARRVGVSFEPSTGVLTATLALREPLLPPEREGFGDSLTLTLSVGGIGPDGHTCAAPGDSLEGRVGDVRLSAAAATGRAPGGAPYTDLFGTVRLAGYSGGLGVASADIDAGRRRITWSFPADAALVGRDLTCVTSVVLGTASGARDEVAPFALSGATRPARTAPDRTPPRVEWISPRDGQTIDGIWQEAAVDGRSPCLIAASDDAGVTRVDVFLDGRFLNREHYAPWACGLDTTRIANGPHTLRAVARDAAGNTSDARIRVVVANAEVASAPVPPPEPPPRRPAPPRPLVPLALAPTLVPSAPAEPVPAELAPPAPGPPLLRVGTPSVDPRVVSDSLTVPVTCDDACRVQVRLVVDARLARRIGVPETLGAGAARSPAGRRTLVRIPLDPATRRALAERGGIRARLQATATGADGRRATVIRPAVLRR